MLAESKGAAYAALAQSVRFERELIMLATARYVQSHETILYSISLVSTGDVLVAHKHRCHGHDLAHLAHDRSLWAVSLLGMGPYLLVRRP